MSSKTIADGIPPFAPRRHKQHPQPLSAPPPTATRPAPPSGSPRPYWLLRSRCSANERPFCWRAGLRGSGGGCRGDRRWGRVSGELPLAWGSRAPPCAAIPGRPCEVSVPSAAAPWRGFRGCRGFGPSPAARARRGGVGPRLHRATVRRERGFAPSLASSRPFVPPAGKWSLASGVRGVPAPLCWKWPYFGKSGFC